VRGWGAGEGEGGAPGGRVSKFRNYNSRFQVFISTIVVAL